MALAIFDLDHTLLDGDSDYLWGRFLVERGIVDAAVYERENEHFYRAYQRGELDIEAYLGFALRPLAEHDPETLFGWRRLFMAESIEPIVRPAALHLVESHRVRGDELLIITATNRFLTEPIAERFGVPELLATTPEMANGRFTGRFEGIPTFREGKVRALDQWLGARGKTLAGSWFYSDSHNDLPLLQRVDNPVAVDPDPQLRAYAAGNGWRIVNLHNGEATHVARDA